MKSRFALVLFAVLILVAGAFAQNGKIAPYVEGSMSATSGGAVTSTSNPMYTVGGGVELNLKHFLVDADATFTGTAGNIGNVFNNGGGYTGQVQGQAYYKMGKFLVGGGGYWSNQVANGVPVGDAFKSFNYLQVRPFVGGGYQFKFMNDRVLVTYVLPGVDQLSGATGIDSKIVRINNEFTLGKTGLMKHVRLTQFVNFNVTNSGYSTASQIFQTTPVTGGAGLKFVF